jgi:tRNA-dihydrouridine synthase
MNNPTNQNKTSLKYVVAPMEGLTTFPSRLWLHMASAPKYMTTPFIKVTKNYPEKKLPDDFAPELTTLKGAFPYELIPQLITGDPENFLRASDIIFPHVSTTVEINCGCPCPTSSGKLAGSGILGTPDLFFSALTRYVSHSGKGHLAVKMRSGFSANSEFQILFDGIKELPLARLTVHARTRKAGYKGLSDWQLIHDASLKTKTPLYGSGDVTSLETLTERLLPPHRLSGVMIGRGAMINPWLFSEIESGQSIQLPKNLLANAVLCYALIHELWQTDMKKLFARIEQGRLGFHCGLDPLKWEKSAKILMQTAGGFPVSFTGNIVPDIPIGGNALARLKVLWGYLRTNLDAAYMQPAIMKSADINKFFTAFMATSDSISTDLLS